MFISAHQSLAPNMYVNPAVTPTGWPGVPRMRARFFAGTDARLKIVLRLKIAFVGQVVYREVEIDPGSNPFGHAQIENVEARSAHALSLPKKFAIRDFSFPAGRAVDISRRRQPPGPGARLSPVALIICYQSVTSEARDHDDYSVVTASIAPASFSASSPRRSPACLPNPPRHTSPRSPLLSPLRSN
jgi:hypothetical protein